MTYRVVKTMISFCYNIWQMLSKQLSTLFWIITTTSLIKTISFFISFSCSWPPNKFRNRNYFTEIKINHSFGSQSSLNPFNPLQLRHCHYAHSSHHGRPQTGQGGHLSFENIKATITTFSLVQKRSKIAATCPDSFHAVKIYPKCQRSLGWIQGGCLAAGTVGREKGEGKRWSLFLAKKSCERPWLAR